MSFTSTMADIGQKIDNTAHYLGNMSFIGVGVGICYRGPLSAICKVISVAMYLFACSEESVTSWSKCADNHFGLGLHCVLGKGKFSIVTLASHYI